MKHKNNGTPSIITNDKNASTTQSQLQILSITFSHQLLRLFSQKSSFQTNPSKAFYQQKNNDSSIITATNQE